MTHRTPAPSGHTRLARPTLSADEVLTTTRAVRRRLDLTSPVPRELVEQCVETAMQAPTGSNRQDFGFVCISDPAQRAAVAAIYARSIDNAVPTRTTYAEGDVRGPAQERLQSAGQYLKEHLAEVPWLVIPVIARKPSASADNRELASLYGSVIPAFWSFMLAARARGLGTVFTTRHLTYERETAELLGIPFDTVMQVGMTPLAYFTGDGFKPAPRIGLEGVLHLDRW